MKEDRTELRDLSGKETKRAKEMAEKWDAWAERTHVKPYPAVPANPDAPKKNNKKKKSSG